MIIYPHAKINLGLRITERRQDGFHNIETVFYPVGLTDILEFLPDDDQTFQTDSLSLSGIPVEGDIKNNLLIKACAIFRERIDIPFLKIHLHKRIPMGAGLGGGSSDAASLLMGMNLLMSNSLPDNDLAEMALQLGSDCPFFLKSEPLLGRGRGEILSPIEVNLKAYYLYLFNPGLHISTAEAYREVTPEVSDSTWTKVLSASPDLWRKEVVNVFEESIFDRYPELAKLKSDLYRLGAVYASMSGSGSSVFGLFSNEIELPSQLKQRLIWQEKIR